MNELIKIVPTYFQGTEVNTVNARELCEKLGVGKDFSTWIKDQIKRARLVEGRDFIIIPEKGEYRKPLTEYYLTIDASKHVAMVSNTEMGYDIREYLIQFEKRHSANAADPVMQMALGMQAAQRYIAEKEEENRKLSYDLSEAVRTKAHISEKREASAMGTASGERKKRIAVEKANAKYKAKESLRKEYRAFTNKGYRKCEHCGYSIDHLKPAYGIPTGEKMPWMHVVHARCFEDHLGVRATPRQYADNCDF